MKKASVPKVEGSVKKASVRKSQPRPCQVRADVGGPICHQHGGKWLRKTGTGAARRDVYSCGDPGCASEVSKCPRCGNLHAARTTDDFIRNIRACERTGPIQPPFCCPCDSCEGQVPRCVPCTWRAPPRTVSARARIRARRFRCSLLTSLPDLPAARGLGATTTSSAGIHARAGEYGRACLQQDAGGSDRSPWQHHAKFSRRRDGEVGRRGLCVMDVQV